MRKLGFLARGPGSQKALQEILRGLEAANPDLTFPRTSSGKYQTNREALEELAGREPIIQSLLEYRALVKLVSTYLAKMAKPVLHPSFNPLTHTGRTSSFGEINAQNLPRDERVRSCFIPSPGHVFLNADYSTVELATLAQSVMSQFDLPSEMAEAINRGEDLHRRLAACVTGKLADQVTADERQKAKAINFGKPGGMGNQGLQAYAKASYGAELSDQEVEEISTAWYDQYPEMVEFLGDDENLRQEVAALLDLTPLSYYEHTGSRSFLDHPANAGRESEPHEILGGMCLKVLKQPEPCIRDGRPYTAEELDYFWSRLAARVEVLPSEHHAAIHDRRASVKLQQAVMRQVGKSPVFTLTGRLRANASFCQRHNTVFQGLAADGAKLGLWYVWRAGYRVVNFIHDELLVEIPAWENLALHAGIIRYLMLQGMRCVVPDVRVGVEWVIADRWYKSAGIAINQKGQLTAWSAENPSQAA